ncbi:MAG TPA: hypothetical protein VGI81_01290 [Tepidisphaeraceae bacterium]|jgi:hypothetical protein
MGTWGTAIFADDTAADVRDDYRDMIASGMSDAEAHAQVRDKYLDVSPEHRPHVEPLFWVALARTQWGLGRLEEETKNKAIDIIDSGSDVERWRDLGASTADLTKRACVLDDLRERLTGPQPPRKSVRPRRKQVSRYQVGDVIRFTLSSGNCVLFRITSIYRDRDGEHPVAEILDWIGISLPAEAELATLPCRQRIRRDGWASVRFPRLLLPKVPKTEFDADRLAVAARGIPMPAVTSESFTIYPWPYLEKALATEFGLR